MPPPPTEVLDFPVEVTDQEATSRAVTAVSLPRTGPGSLEQRMFGRLWVLQAGVGRGHPGKELPPTERPEPSSQAQTTVGKPRA